MSKIIGRQIEVGVAVEATRGTKEASASHWIKKQNFDLIPQASHAIDEMTFGKIEDSEKRRVTQKWVEGDLSGNVQADAIGYLLYSLFGEVSSTLLGSSVYEHEFTIGQNIVHPSLSLFRKEGAIDQYVCNGVMVQSLEISSEQDQYVQYTASLIGRDYEADASAINYVEEYDFIGRDVTVKLASSEAGLAGATAQKLKSVSVTFEPNTEANFILGSRNPEDIHNKQFGITGEFELDYVNDDFLSAYNTDDANYMLVEIEGEANLGGGNAPKLSFLFNKVQIMDRSVADQANDLVQETVSFKAFYNESDGAMVTSNLVNLTEEYEPNVSA